jgi:hypothetical protein
MAGARQSAGEDIRGRIRYLGWHKEGPPYVDRSIDPIGVVIPLPLSYRYADVRLD